MCSVELDFGVPHRARIPTAYIHVMNSHVSILYGILDKHRVRKWFLMADLPQEWLGNNLFLL